ncbi:hypothetical protein N566_18485 [Streptomycetaceae bacterium MP113-05]|nr:hypothetical protein N566_18485 [Streptomycetaceae bacterium MP113-05]
MGWTVLYTAFGIVAVWLLFEVLLQYKARLRWRLLAFGGFSTVVVGVVALSSVIVIVLGAVAFAVGQTFVTLSYRRGFSTGWALGGMPGSSRRRREGGERQRGEDVDPAPEGSGFEEGRGGDGGHDSGYPEDPYGTPPHGTDTSVGSHGEATTGAYDVYDGGEDPSVFAPAAPQQGPEGDEAPTAGWDGTDGYGHGHGYGTEEQYQQHQYASYSDPYSGYDPGQYTGTGFEDYGAAAALDAPGGYGAQGYAGQGYGDQGWGDGGYGGQGWGAQGYAGQGYGDQGWGDGGGYGTDGYGGAWVPQQREPAPEPYPYQNPYQGQDAYGAGGYGGGYGEDGLGAGYGYPNTGNGYPADTAYGTGQDDDDDAPTGGGGRRGYGYDGRGY